MAIKKRPPFWAIAVIAVVLLAIELGLRFTPPDTEHWHYALHRFYYLAIITGATDDDVVPVRMAALRALAIIGDPELASVPGFLRAFECRHRGG